MEAAIAMRCAECGWLIDPKKASDPCPQCGSVNRQISIKDSARGREMLKLKAKDSGGFTLFERKAGDKLSACGHEARELLEFNHRDPNKTTKTHIVEEQGDNGSWVITHKERKEFPAKRRSKQKADG